MARQPKAKSPSPADDLGEVTAGVTRLRHDGGDARTIGLRRQVRSNAREDVLGCANNIFSHALTLEKYSLFYITWYFLWQCQQPLA